jgi:DNA-binding NarL/FixJ family response regulator
VAAALILVVDDDAGIRSLICEVLSQGGFATRAVETGEAALAAAREQAPQVVVLDVVLPGLSGYEVCRALVDEFGSAVQVMFISGEQTRPLDRVAGLLIGAEDYLAKPFAPDELLARVRSLVRRAQPTEAQRKSDLTHRELEVLGLLAQGLGQAEIASKLVLSPKTVSNHIQHTMTKLGVHSRSQAVAQGYRHRLV